MNSLFTLFAFVIAFLFLFNGIRRISADIGANRGRFEAWVAMIVYPAVYIGASYSAALLERLYGDNIFNTVIALAVTVYIALRCVAFARKRYP